jgi:hypothetical protein
LSSKGAGAPTGAGAMAQTPDYSKAYSSGVGMIPVAAKALKGVGSSAYSAYKGVRRYFNKPRSYKPRKPKTSSKRRLNPILSSKNAGAPTGDA